MLGLLIGLFIGSFIGILVATFCAIASENNEPPPSNKKNAQTDTEGEIADE